MFIDIHTHRAGNSTSIANSFAPQADGFYYSAGIHPWDITPHSAALLQELATTATCANVVAIGECGIDKIKSPATIATQTEIFAAQARIANAVNKPLIIHCVKAHSELIALHRTITPTVAWILHGFRGNPTLAQQLLKEGFHLSFGEKFNPQSVAATPLHRLFVESDTSPLPIEDIYAAVAQAAGVGIETLAAAVQKNAVVCNIGIGL
jgi:TatD DNase family protein